MQNQTLSELFTDNKNLNVLATLMMFLYQQENFM